MNPERWNKIKALFSSAQDVPEDERHNFLSRACGADRELRSEVEKLLDSDRNDDSFLEDSAVAEVTSILNTPQDSGSAAPHRFESGKMLSGRYEILRLLGRGGMGEVYLANDTRIRRKVALKVLHSDLISNKESLRRFALEAQAASALNHPHIMTIHEFDHAEDGTVFFVAEYVDGRTLNSACRDGLAVDKALDIAIQVSLALSAAHEAGITHRDIKPENIMLRPDGYVKVLDFGLAKLTQKEASLASAGPEDPTVALTHTRPGAIMGTAAYMSPEQARGLAVDARTDIWSLGAVIYEMLAGTRPFQGKTAADIIVAVLSGEPPPLASHGGELPIEMQGIVSKALSKNVDERYQTADDIRTDLEQLKKQIEFGANYSGPSADPATGEAENDLATAKQRVPTAVDAERPTSGGQNQSSGFGPMAPTSGFGAFIRQARDNKLVYSALALTLLAFTLFAVYFGFTARPPAAQIDSIAVLPLDTIGGNGEMAYASDGISEALIDRLSQLPQLKVISRNSSFKFRGPDVDVRNVSAQLSARAVVTGSVTKIGDEFVIRIDIVDTAENRQLTGAQYRRKAGDLVGIPNEIAKATADQLQLKLTDSQARRFTSTPTEDSEAFRYYLNGLVDLNGSENVRGRALENFERAVALDPGFAAAHAEIAWVYWARANASDDPAESMPKARASVERALAIDPNLAKAHVLLAGIREYEFDWRAAEAEYRRAIDLSPNLDFARNNFAFFLSLMGRQDEAMTELEQQRLRDPINLRLGLLYKAFLLTQARKFDDALAVYSQAQAFEPSNEVPAFALGYAYGGKGLHDQAVSYYRKAIDVLGGEEKYSQPLVYLAATYARMPEKRAEARSILTRIESMRHYKSPALLAAVYGALGDNDKAFALLERGYIERDLLLRYIATGYEYDDLRGDPRFGDLIKRVGIQWLQSELHPAASRKKMLRETTSILHIRAQNGS